MKDPYIRTDICGFAFNGKFPPNSKVMRQLRVYLRGEWHGGVTVSVSIC